MLMRDKSIVLEGQNRTKRGQNVTYYCYLDTTIIHITGLKII
jgi:hypothetical protein